MTDDQTQAETNQSTDDAPLKDVTDETELMLSTIDNPFNPKTHYDEWKKFDTDNEYYTEEYIARLLVMEPEFEADDEFMLNILMTKVLEDILDNDDEDVYVLV